MEGDDLPLNLNPIQTGTPVFTGGVSIDNMSWWFWIKAGMGFTLGAGLAAFFWALLWYAFWLTAFFGAMGALRR